MSTERLAGARALVVGDVMLDEHIWGQVSRISPEAPVPVVEVRHRRNVPGGAANAAAGIAALGGRVSIGGAVGEDAAAVALRAALEERGVGCGGLVAVPARSTTTKTRIIAHNQQVVRLDAEERAPLSDEATHRLLAWIEHAIEATDVLVVSDYGKGVVSRNLAQTTIGYAAKRGIPVVVDPKGSDYAKYKGATILTPNVEDAKRAADFAADTFVEFEEVTRRLGDVLPGSYLLVTRGPEGMTLLGRGTTVDIPTEAHEVYDVTGAGDTVVAVLAVALARGFHVLKAVRIANAAAGIAVRKVGTATVGLDELAVRLESHGQAAVTERHH